MTIISLDEYIEWWWDQHEYLVHTELGSNGQFDELPYWEYEKYIEELCT